MTLMGAFQLSRRYLRAGYALAPVVLAFLLAACSPPTPPQRPEDLTAPAAGAPVLTHQTDIGDVEAALRIEASLDPAAKTPTVTSEQLVNAKGQVDMETITVAPPFPASLPVKFVRKVPGLRLDAPTVARVKILRDKNMIDSFAFVLTPGTVFEPFEHVTDALAGIPSPPASLLLHAEAELILLPVGTDPATVDPATATGAPDMTGAVVSNPVRIEFKNGEPSP